ncbi:heavy-metal-associated domain-containing protein [Clostridium lacusfryxellense]|uniref:heavy-metal-associated domain-containing protein n=1 Tax=Clostridium lacusfryxellense TaxID=205328 RepID=UPI001C0D2BB0|nr:heavy-metal-associated domain-containing protein [Clostridium lacusfryxellense]MBU3114706.1 copper resistance protein CopZ [Clostridium lacusfryxellense]
MKYSTANFKQYNMLCDKCLINVIKCLSNLHGIDGLEISLESKKIKVIYKDKTITKKMIQDKVNETILTGKVKNIYGFNS